MESETQYTINGTKPERRVIPRVFLAFLAEYGYRALEGYLVESGAPAEIVELSQALEALSCLQETDQNADALLGGAVGQLARGLHYAGTDLHAPGGAFTA